MSNYASISEAKYWFRFDGIDSIYCLRTNSVIIGFSSYLVGLKIVKSFPLEKLTINSFLHLTE